jgi:hypothetical protein
MAKPLISDREMGRLAKDYGPSLNDGYAYIERRTAGVKKGMGYTKGNTTLIGPMGIRVVYISNMNVREKLEAGQLATAGDYLISLPAGTVVYTSDIIVKSAKPWQATERVIAGSRRAPTADTNQVLVAQADGTTGAVEPLWPDDLNEAATVEDGTVTWQNIGKAERFQVIQQASPSTYGDKFATKVTASLAQEVRQPTV